MSNLTRALHVARKRVDDREIADALGGDVSTVSRIFSDQHGVKLSRLESFLRTLGYRAIPLAREIRELPNDHYDSLVILADIGVDALRRGEVHPRFYRGLKAA